MRKCYSVFSTTSVPFHFVIFYCLPYKIRLIKLSPCDTCGEDYRCFRRSRVCLTNIKIDGRENGLCTPHFDHKPTCK